MKRKRLQGRLARKWNDDVSDWCKLSPAADAGEWATNVHKVTGLGGPSGLRAKKTIWKTGNVLAGYGRGVVYHQ